MAEKKLVKRDYFEMLKGMEEVKGNEQLVAFIDHELELLAKKSSKSGSTKTQKENEPIIANIYETLKANGGKMTITDLQNTSETLAELSNQKISSLLTKLVNDKKVDRIKEKKMTYFVAIAE